MVSETPIEFIPFDAAQPVREFTHEFGEAPLPADDDRHVETHESEGSVPELRGLVEPGMDIDTVTLKSTRQSEDNDAAEIELKELLEVVTRDIRREIKEHDAEIIAVIRSFGVSALQYR